MVNWCFNKEPAGWGVKRKMGGLDVTRLIGEANDGGNDCFHGLHQRLLWCQ
jgi:hypothetical protein